MPGNELEVLNHYKKKIENNLDKEDVLLRALTKLDKVLVNIALLQVLILQYYIILPTLRVMVNIVVGWIWNNMDNLTTLHYTYYKSGHWHWSHREHTKET